MSFHMVVPWIGVPIPKTQVSWPNAIKEALFLHFLCPSVKNSNGRQSDNFGPRRSAYGPSESLCPKFSKTHLRKVSIFKMWVLHPSKVRWSRFVSLKNAVFSELFWRKSFFDPLQPSIPPPMIYINGKLCMSAFRTYPNQQAIRILLTVGDRNLPMYWDLVVIKVRSVDKNCLHMEICQPNKNCLFWSQSVKNVTKLR